MKVKTFTDEELREIRLADIEIDADFNLTAQEILEAEQRDREAKWEALDNRAARAAKNRYRYVSDNAEHLKELRRKSYIANQSHEHDCNKKWRKLHQSDYHYRLSKITQNILYEEKQKIERAAIALLRKWSVHT